MAEFPIFLPMILKATKHILIISLNKRNQWKAFHPNCEAEVPSRPSPQHSGGLLQICSQAGLHDEALYIYTPLPLTPLSPERKRQWKLFLEAQPQEWSRWVLTATQGSGRHSNEWMNLEEKWVSLSLREYFRCPNWRGRGQNTLEIWWASSGGILTTIHNNCICTDIANAGGWKQAQGSVSEARKQRDKHLCWA